MQTKILTNSFSLFKQKNIFLIVFLWCFLSFLYTSSTHALCLAGWSCNEGTSLSLQISNSFSAETSLLTTGYVSWWITYISTPHVQVQVHASTGSDFILSGSDIAEIYTGSGTGDYTQTHFLDIQWSDGIKVIPSTYLKWQEPLTAHPLQVFLDTTPPTQANPMWPGLNELVQDADILFSWWESTDTGAWLDHYLLVISTDPWFSTPFTFPSSNTSIAIDHTLLPTWMLYRYIQAIDHIWNTSIGLPAFFINQSNNYISKWTLSSITRNTSSWNNTWKYLQNTSTIDDKEHESANVPDTKSYSIREQIRRQNILRYISNRNKKYLASHPIYHLWNGYNNTYGDNVYSQITLPWYLAKTWADPHTIQKYLTLLAEWSWNKKIKKQLYTLIHFIQPWRPTGIILITVLLCYDIEIWKRWQKIQRKQKKKRNTKKVIKYLTY